MIQKFSNVVASALCVDNLPFLGLVCPRQDDGILAALEGRLQWRALPTARNVLSVSGIARTDPPYLGLCADHSRVTPLSVYGAGL